jgi:hypothetical protein
MTRTPAAAKIAIVRLAVTSVVASRHLILCQFQSM